MPWVYLVIAILAEVIASSALKASEGFQKLIPSILVVSGYGVAFFFLSLSLKSIRLGIAYAIWSGLGVVVLTLIGFFYYKETLDLGGIIGISLILAGVLVLNLFSKTLGH